MHDRAARSKESTEPIEMNATDKTTSQDCPTCGQATNHRLLYQTNGCDIWQCQSCGLGRTDTTGFDPNSYYTGDYFSGHHSDGYSDYRAAEPVLRREFARSVVFVRGYRPGGRLLDLGCAYGFFLKEAEPYFEVAGIELAEEAAAHGRQSGLNVLSGVADETNLARIGPVDAEAPDHRRSTGAPSDGSSDGPFRSGSAGGGGVSSSTVLRLSAACISACSSRMFASDVGVAEGTPSGGR